MWMLDLHHELEVAGKGSERSFRCWGCFLEEEETLRVAGIWAEERGSPACCLRSAYPVPLNVHVCVVEVFFFFLFFQPKSSDLNGHSQWSQIAELFHIPQAKSHFFSSSIQQSHLMVMCFGPLLYNWDTEDKEKSVGKCGAAQVFWKGWLFLPSEGVLLVIVAWIE